MDLQEYLNDKGFDATEFTYIIRDTTKEKISSQAIRNYLHGKTLPKLNIALAIEEVTHKKVTCEELAEYWRKKNGKNS